MSIILCVDTRAGMTFLGASTKLFGSDWKLFRVGCAAKGLTLIGLLCAACEGNGIWEGAKSGDTCRLISCLVGGDAIRCSKGSCCAICPFEAGMACMTMSCDRCIDRSASIIRSKA
jgi:hypothetical protein